MPLGTLRQQLLFPSTDENSLSDAQLHKLLALVMLPELAQKLGGLDSENDWVQVRRPDASLKTRVMLEDIMIGIFTRPCNTLSMEQWI